MNHLYDIGYGTMEESSYSQYHKDGPKLTDDELRDIVKQCFLEAWESLDEDQLTCIDSFQELMGIPTFHDGLVKRGFCRLEFAARFDVFGWGKFAAPGEGLCGAGDADDRELQEWMKKETQTP